MYTAPLAYFVIYCVHQMFTLNILCKQRSHNMAGLFMESAIYCIHSTHCNHWDQYKYHGVTISILGSPSYKYQVIEMRGIFHRESEYGISHYGLFRFTNHQFVDSKDENLVVT